MERMFTIVFDDEAKAREGTKALAKLDSDGDISIYAEAVITKNKDGTVTLKQAADDFPVNSVSGSAVGALVGLLGGTDPVLGAAAGAVAGTVGAVDRAGVNVEFLDQVSEKLKPGKWAILLDASEEKVTPLDSKMEALDGIVFRTARQNVEDEQDARAQAAMNEDLSQMKKEEKEESRREEKEKLRGKIDNLEQRLHARMQLAKQNRERWEKETKAKIRYLELKAAKQRSDAKARIEARIDSLRKKSKPAETAPAQQTQQQKS